MKKTLTHTLVALALLSSVGVLTTAPVQAEEEEVVEYADDRVLVQIEAGVDPQVVAAEYGIEKVQPLGDGAENWNIFYVNPGEVDDWMDKLRDAKYIKLIERDIRIFPQLFFDPAYKDQWHQKYIGADQLWKSNRNYRTIAFIDSGVDYSHPDLSGKIVQGYDFVNYDPIANDEYGTGTHIAGIAAATHNNLTGGKGVDPTAKIMPLKVMNENGVSYTSTIADAIYWATHHGADVISITAGTTVRYTSVLQSAINYAWQRGDFIVSQAGNNSSTTPRYPASYSHVFSVNAIDPEDNLWYRSNRGPWVDISAPGTYIYSTKLGGGMYHYTGTERAVGVTAGAASLVWKSGMTNVGVENYLIDKALPIPYTGTYWYHGRLNLI
ncbi:hypothetical protein CBW65_02330 [Tumebacillus avium]|uniref:Peptidase S8/S53 domain-containing protein n=1 Tax=Tumebacillus avium TaxID=1903704 RepID=A0A1Y0IIA2_9BACL|nr:S8 family serine peptidase [Tumebacillus avium]ARU60030.1 hypothetical protein CBW65_02330 [Tumebacillus avium]